MVRLLRSLGWYLMPHLPRRIQAVWLDGYMKGFDSASLVWIALILFTLVLAGLIRKVRG